MERWSGGAVERWSGGGSMKAGTWWRKCRQIKAASSSSGETTLRGWISIIWFSSAVGIAGGHTLELETTPEVLARCGDNVTLTCNANSSQKLDVKLFTWSDGRRNLCPLDDGQRVPDVLCETTASPALKATLINVMPVYKGRYLCKLQSNLGATSAQTLLSVQDCLESSDFRINSSHAECRFTGVHPRGNVHWFQGDDNLTDSATTQEEEDQHGRYDVRSTIRIEERKSSEAYNCSLWMPDDRKYLSNQKLIIVGELIGRTTGSPPASGCRVQLQWICIMVEILVFQSMV
ncbi:hypothetical protein EXN66_Car016076 [Channa argus]|uniref:Ig-like domain-containing protein n=1 Tax=Channa argus TaxID=215402 RepID=A0A6G1QDA7_CHAAH|nr:hypothetical protein EXN66_Car016076 [Channa argus]